MERIHIPVILMLSSLLTACANGPGAAAGDTAPTDNGARAAAAPPAGEPREGVVLLHGLCRSAAAMRPMQKALERAGYVVQNVGYPSRTAPVETLSENAIGPALAGLRERGVTRTHFVTHSLGGILVRCYAKNHPGAVAGRVVMLGPPNGGSEVVDALGKLKLFSLINGPAGGQLGTGPDSLPSALGPADFSVGIIAGTRTINWINSFAMIPGPDDGKVSVENTRLAGMSDHCVLPVTHTFMMRDKRVIAQTLAFLQNGKFNREG